MSDWHYHGYLVDADRKRNAIKAVQDAPEGFEVIIQAPKRSNKHNALLWVVLSQMEARCLWHGLRLDREEWKDLASAAVRQLRVVPNVEGNGFVGLGKKTSSMSARMINQIIDILCAIAGGQGVEIVITESKKLESHEPHRKIYFRDCLTGE